MNNLSAAPMEFSINLWNQNHILTGGNPVLLQSSCCIWNFHCHDDWPHWVNSQTKHSGTVYIHNCHTSDVQNCRTSLLREQQFTFEPAQSLWVLGIKSDTFLKLSGTAVCINCHVIAFSILTKVKAFNGLPFLISLFNLFISSLSSKALAYILFKQFFFFLNESGISQDVE